MLGIGQASTIIMHSQIKSNSNRDFLGKKTKNLIRFGSCILLLIILFFFACNFDLPIGGRFKYHYLVIEMKLAYSLRNINKYLPSAFAHPVHNALSKPMEAYTRQKQSFLNSGFLTNLSIILTNASMSLAKSNTPGISLVEIDKRLSKISSFDWLAVSMVSDVQGNRVYLNVTCPTNDVTLIKAAFADE
jgi:hypothetical protein